MFNKFKTSKISNEIYDTILLKVNEIHNIMKKYDLIKQYKLEFLNFESFSSFSIIFYYGIYREKLDRDYGQKMSFIIMQTGIHEMGLHLTNKSASNNSDEFLLSLYFETYQKIIGTINKATANKEDIFESVALLYLVYILKKEGFPLIIKNDNICKEIAAQFKKIYHDNK